MKTPFPMQITIATMKVVKVQKSTAIFQQASQSSRYSVAHSCAAHNYHTFLLGAPEKTFLIAGAITFPAKLAEHKAQGMHVAAMFACNNVALPRVFLSSDVIIAFSWPIRELFYLLLLNYIKNNRPTASECGH